MTCYKRFASRLHVLSIAIALFAVHCGSQAHNESRESAHLDSLDAGNAENRSNIKGDSVTSGDTVCEISLRTFDIPIKNGNPKYFGYAYHVFLGGGPASIDIDGDYAYVVDNYHHNIKRIDLHDGSFQVSDTFISPHKGRLFDIQVLGDSIFVSNHTDSLYVLSKDMRYLGVIPLPSALYSDDLIFLRRPGKPVEVNGNAFLVTIDRGRTHVDSIGHTDPRWEGLTARRYAGVGFADSTLNDVNLGDGRILKLFHDLPDMKDHWGMNTAISGKYFACFGLRRDMFTLYLYEIGDCER